MHVLCMFHFNMNKSDEIKIKLNQMLRLSHRHENRLQHVTDDDDDYVIQSHNV